MFRGHIKTFMSRLASSGNECQVLGRTGKRTADQRGSPAGLDAYSKFDSTQHFCQRCKEIGIPAMLEGEKEALYAGLLDEFDDPLCQLCNTINHFTKQHWDHENLSMILGSRPRVGVQSNPWCSTLRPSGLPRYLRRVDLALAQGPDLQHLRQSMASDEGPHFILTELEIDPTRTGDSNISTTARRPILPYLDLALVRAWLDDCRSRHGSWVDNQALQGANTMQSLFSNGFRLIDVFEGRLVEEINPCEYVALSYVWGQAASFMLRTNKANVLDLCQPSSLHKPYFEHGVSKRLPKTIADAMSLSRSIGQRYLWVDSLCIVQDDPGEKRRLVHGMNSVYENASLTLVALSGVDADAGLAGISPRGPETDNCGRRYLFHEVYGKCCIGIGRDSLIKHIESSHWNTRGWTYQEQLLSPRKLYFTPGEVFYDCHCQQPREGYAFEGLEDLKVTFGYASSGGIWDRDPLEHAEEMFSVGQTINWETLKTSGVQTQDLQFQRIVSLYTRRQLKDPGDILHALTGVYNKFYASSDTHGIDIDALQGLPVRCFARALLWFTPDPCSTRRCDVSGFKPSTWSWVSWISPVEFACETKPTFPLALGGTYRSGTNTFSMVEEWCLTFQKENDMVKARFPGRKFYDKVERSIYPYYGIGVKEFLESRQKEDRNIPRALEEPAPQGLLEFRALYIPAPTAEKFPKWSQKLEREWHLSFAGTEVYDKIFDCMAVALFDCEETVLDGFVLLLSDYSFMGICVKEVEGYFERVGICIFTNSRKDWECVLEKGLLEIYWKRIMLR